MSELAESLTAEPQAQDQGLQAIQERAAKLSQDYLKRQGQIQQAHELMMVGDAQEILAINHCHLKRDRPAEEPGGFNKTYAHTDCEKVEADMASNLSLGDTVNHHYPNKDTGASTFTKIATGAALGAGVLGAGLGAASLLNKDVEVNVPPSVVQEVDPSEYRIDFGDE